MKKIIALLLALVLVCAGFAACSAEDGKITDEAENTTINSDVVEEDTTAADNGTDEVIITESQPDAVTADIPTATVLEETKNVTGEYDGADADIPAEFLADTYGVKPEWVKEYSAQMPMISFRIDTHMVIKANEGFAGDVEKALNDYQTYQVENSMQYPMNVPKLKAARVYRLGDYVFYILTGYVPDEYMDDEEGAYNYAAKNNQMVVDKVTELLLAK